jgi:hypothetical protein
LPRASDPPGGPTDGLAERADPELAACGKWAAAELRRLCRLILRWRDCDSDAGRFVRHIDKEMAALFTFLLEEGVEPTNNLAERMLRFGVLWRKRSQGNCSQGVSKKHWRLASQLDKIVAVNFFRRRKL